MGKFSQAGSTGGGLSALERLAFEAQPDLPTGVPEEQVQERPQQPNIQPGTAQDPGVNRILCSSWLDVRLLRSLLDLLLLSTRR